MSVFVSWAVVASRYNEEKFCHAGLTAHGFIEVGNPPVSYILPVEKQVRAVHSLAEESVLTLSENQ